MYSMILKVCIYICVYIYTCLRIPSMYVYVCMNAENADVGSSHTVSCLCPQTTCQCIPRCSHMCTYTYTDIHMQLYIVVSTYLCIPLLHAHCLYGIQVWTYQCKTCIYVYTYIHKYMSIRLHVDCHAHWPMSHANKCICTCILTYTVATYRLSYCIHTNQRMLIHTHTHTLSRWRAATYGLSDACRETVKKLNGVSFETCSSNAKCDTCGYSKDL
jgi:hypothetical protein